MVVCIGAQLKAILHARRKGRRVHDFAWLGVDEVGWRQ